MFTARVDLNDLCDLVKTLYEDAVFEFVSDPKNAYDCEYCPYNEEKSKSLPCGQEDCRVKRKEE